MVWLNGRLTVFHGTDYASLSHLVAGISLSKCSPLTDFGRGFYTTTQIHQARQWANQRLRRLSLAHQRGNHAVVGQYSIDRDQLSVLDHLTFVTDTPDYYDLVSYSRVNKSPIHGRISGSPYDVVYGPVSLYPQALTIGNCDQISFHSMPAISILKLDTVWSGSPFF